MTSEKDFTNRCLNCGATVQEDYLYCAKCSQRLRTSKISVWSLLSEFVAGMFNLDSRLYQSLAKLMQPGFLTKAYIQGKRKRYLNPARFFLFSMLFHFAVLAYVIKGNQPDIMFGGDSTAELNQDMAEIALVKRYDSLAIMHPIDTITIDSLRKQLFQPTTSGRHDSIPLPGTVGDFNSFDNHEYHINDILNMGEEEFLDHYGVETFSDRFLVKQELRLYRNPQGMFSFFLGNLIWAVALSFVFLSFIMKLLYIRKKRFYVEHLILMMHIHCFIFILLGISWLVDRWFGPTNGLWILAIVGISLLYFFLSIKKYYDQGFIKTLIKFIIILLAYIVINFFCAIGTLLLSMLIF